MSNKSPNEPGFWLSRGSPSLEAGPGLGAAIKDVPGRTGAKAVTRREEQVGGHGAGGRGFNQLQRFSRQMFVAAASLRQTLVVCHIPPGSLIDAIFHYLSYL
jgi:hypothetical protein